MYTGLAVVNHIVLIWIMPRTLGVLCSFPIFARMSRGHACYWIISEFILSGELCDAVTTISFLEFVVQESGIIFLGQK